MKVAFIGLGNMGGGMAANLVKAGHEVNAFDLSADALARAEENGCVPLTSLREAVTCVDASIPMGQRVAELSAHFDAAGNGGMDFSAIIECSKAGTYAKPV